MRRSWPSFVTISRMIFSSMATLAAPSTEYGLGLPTLSSTHPFGEGIRGNVNCLVGVMWGSWRFKLLDRDASPGAAAEAACCFCAAMVCRRSLRDLRMSSSREFVASLRLMRSVALSLLRRLNCDMSFCRLETIELMLMSWVEMESTC
jgi:hypothetical protein